MLSANLWAGFRDALCDLGLTDGYINDNQTEWVVEFCKDKWLFNVANLDYDGMNHAIYTFCSLGGELSLKHTQIYEVEWEGKEEKVMVLSCILRKNANGDIMIKE